MSLDVLALLAKMPVPGLVKTRLAESIGAEAAAGLAQAMLMDLVAEHQACDYDLVVVSNAGESRRMQELVPGTSVLEAEGDELRGPQSIVLQAFRQLLKRYDKAAIVCGDVPFVSSVEIKEALRHLTKQILCLALGLRVVTT